MKKLVRESPFPQEDLILCWDNHGSHLSRLVTDYIRDSGLTVYQLPAYSSIFSPAEKLWAYFKTEWAKNISSLRTDNYNNDNLEQDIAVICSRIGSKLTHNILYSADGYMQRSIQGELV